MPEKHKRKQQNTKYGNVNYFDREIYAFDLCTVRLLLATELLCWDELGTVGPLQKKIYSHFVVLIDLCLRRVRRTLAVSN